MVGFNHKLDETWCMPLYTNNGNLTQAIKKIEGIFVEKDTNNQ